MLFKDEQIVSLSQPLLLGKEHFPYEVKAQGFMEDRWYIECICTMGSHIGTHVEVTYHHDKDGADMKDYPFRDLIGECVVINCEGKQPGDPITVEDIKNSGVDIHQRDIVFLHTGYDRFFRDEEKWQPYPYVTIEALDYLLQFNIKALGTDASGVELSDGYDEEGRMNELEGEPIHVKCFQNNVAIVESLTNLGEIEGIRTNVFILPAPAEKMDAFPCQIIAIKDL